MHINVSRRASVMVFAPTRTFSIHRGRPWSHVPSMYTEAEQQTLSRCRMQTGVRGKRYCRHSSLPCKTGSYRALHSHPAQPASAPCSRLHSPARAPLRSSSPSHYQKQRCPFQGSPPQAHLCRPQPQNPSKTPQPPSPNPRSYPHCRRTPQLSWRPSCSRL